MAKKSSNPIKGYFAQKIPNFFSGRFYRKSLENPAKTAKKNLQNHAKNTRFLRRKTAKNKNDFKLKFCP